jgi:hypothetical protein
MQPLVKVDGTICFRANPVVRQMLNICKANGMGLNELLIPNYPQRDVEQFYQLIGYSLDMYEELSFISDRSVAMAKRRVRQLERRRNSFFAGLARKAAKEDIRWLREECKGMEAERIFGEKTDDEIADGTLVPYVERGEILESEITDGKRKVYRKEYIRLLRRAKIKLPSDIAAQATPVPTPSPKGNKRS